MARMVKKVTSDRRPTREAERTVVCHGIKIAPIAGKRSPTAEAIRDALRTKSESGLAKPAHT